MMATEFRLSRVVHGHRADVKCLAPFQNSFASCSRDETVKFWAERKGDYTESLSLAQGMLVNSLAFYQPPVSTTSVPVHSWLIFVGRKDGSIAVFSSGNQEPVVILHEHKSNVCILFVDAIQQKLISGSWDCTAIVWPICEIDKNSGDFKAECLTGHSMSVWSASTVPECDNFYLTGSADKTIRLWQNDVHVKTFAGHTDVVRGILTVSGNLFLSCSNDGSIRRWDMASGMCLGKCQSLIGDYLYGMAEIGISDDREHSLLATGGEGGLLEVYNFDRKTADLQRLQHLKLPAESLWCVVGLTNGDIAVAASDSLIYIFTRDESRLASADAVCAFDERVANQLAQEMAKAGKDESDVVTISVAIDEGMPNLQLKYVKGTDPLDAAEAFLTENNLPAGYLGQVTDFIKQNVPEAAKFTKTFGNGRNAVESRKKVHFNGKEWDYVFDMSLEDGQQLKLPCNRGEEPNMVAQRFLEDNRLPIQFLPQISQFINTEMARSGQAAEGAYQDPFTGQGRYVPPSGNGINNSAGAIPGQDPFTGTGRYVPGSVQQNDTGINNHQLNDPFTGTGRYIPAGDSGSVMPNASRPLDKKRPRSELVPLREYFYFGLEQASADKAVTRLKENNSQLEQYRLDEQMMAALQALMMDEKSKVCENQICALKIGLKWPVDQILPILDIFRIGLLQAEINCYFFDAKTTENLPNNTDTLDSLMNLLNSETSGLPVKIVVCRALANAFKHKWGRHRMLHSLSWSATLLIDTFAGAASKHPLQLASSSALANLSLMLVQRAEFEHIAELGPREDVLRPILDRLKQIDAFDECSQPALIRLLQTVSTLMWGDSCLITIGKQMDLLATVNRIKDIVRDENGKNLARDIVEMAYAV